MHIQHIRLPEPQVHLELTGLNAAAPFGAASVRALAFGAAHAGTAAWLRINRGWLIDIDLWHAPFAQRGRLLVAGNTRRAQAWGGWPRSNKRSGKQPAAPPMLAYWARKQMHTLGPAELRMPKTARSAAPDRTAKQFRLAFAFTPGALRSVLASAYGRCALSAALPRTWLDNATRAHRWFAHYLAALAQIPFHANERLRHVQVDVAGIKWCPAAPAIPSAASRGAPAGWLEWLSELEQRESLAHWRQQIQAQALVVVADMKPGAGLRNTGLYGLTPDVPQRRRRRGHIVFPRVVLVDANSALSRHMLAHEIGHLIGCEHAPANIDSPTRDRIYSGFYGAAAHGWIDPQLRLQTATADIDQHAPYTYDVAPLWSDPRTRWGNMPCGRAGYADQVSHWLRALPEFLQL